MTTSTARTNQRHATFAQRSGNKVPALSSTKPAAASQESRSFVAALLKALSAFAA